MDVSRLVATLSVAAVLALGFLPTTSVSQEIPSEPAVLEAFLDGMIQSQLREKDIAGATVAVVGGGEVLLTKGYGWADVEARVPVDPEETLFRIGSVTKLFTYVAAMQLVEEGRLDLDEDVNEYLDFRIPDTFPEPITLRHLMMHTAGFEEDARNLFTEDPDRIMALESWLRENLPTRVQPPGLFSSYSNYGSALVGHLVERVSGLDFDDYLEAHLLEPLGMSRTTARQPLPDALAPGMSGGYVPHRGGFQAEPWEIILGGAPAGSVSSTAQDMAAFMLALLGGGELDGVRVLGDETVREMHRQQFYHDPRVPGYGLGFYELSSHGVRIVGHGGNTRLFHTMLALFPDHDFGLFISYNTATAAPLTLDSSLHTFLDQFVPDPPPPVREADPEALARLAGTYRLNRMSHTTFQKVMALAMSFSVRAEDGILTGRSPLGELRLVEVEPLLFREELGSTMVAFRTDEAGRGTHAFLSVAPMMAAERVPWHGSPTLHLAILGGSYILFLGLLIAGVVGLVRRRGRPEPVPRVLVLVRRALFGAALANVAFVVWVAVLLRDFWGFLTTPMTGFALALTLPVLGALAVLVAAGAVVVLWKEGVGSRWLRFRYTGAVLLCLLFVWSLYYWNLLGWRL